MSSQLKCFVTTFELCDGPVLVFVFLATLFCDNVLHPPFVIKLILSIIVLTFITSYHKLQSVGILSICALCRLLDSMKEIPVHGKLSWGDVQHPVHKR